MERKPGFCQPFIGFDMEGDAVMLIGVYDDDGERIRYMLEEELDLLLGKVGGSLHECLSGALFGGGHGRKTGGPKVNIHDPKIQDLLQVVAIGIVLGFGMLVIWYRTRGQG